MSAVKVRAPRLTKLRPVSARRAVGGSVRLVVVSDVGERAAMVAASFVGVMALLAAAVGVAVIW